VHLSWVYDPDGTGNGDQLARQTRYSVNAGTSWTQQTRSNSSSKTRDVTAQPGQTMLVQIRTYDQDNAASDWSNAVEVVCLQDGESVPVTPPPTPPSFPVPEGSGMWVWSTPSKVKAGHYPPTKLISIALELGLKRLFVWAQPAIGSNVSFINDVQIMAWLTELRQLCDANDLYLDALFGDAWYCIPTDAYPNNPFKQALSNWATDCAASGLFDRLHLDNEPAGVNADPELVDLGWNWPANNQDLMRGTLEGYDMVKAAAPSMALDVDVQYQIWDSSNANYANFEMADGSRFGDHVMATVDGVAVMSYQVSTALSIAKATPAAEAGAAANVPVWSGINVDDEGNDPGSSLLTPGYTFAQLITDVGAMESGMPNTVGVGVHEADQVIVLWDAHSPTPPITPPGPPPVTPPAPTDPLSDTSPIRVAIYDRDGHPQDWLGAPLSVSVKARVSAASDATVTADADDPQGAVMMEPGSRVVIDLLVDPAEGRRQVLLAGEVTQRSGAPGQIDGATEFVVEDARGLIMGLLIAPSPSSMPDPGTLGTVGAESRTLTGPAETVLKTLVAENAGWQGVPVVVAPDQGRGQTVTMAARFDAIGEYWAGFVAAGVVPVVTVGSDGSWLFDVSIPTEIVDVLTQASGVVQPGSWKVLRPSVTRVVVLGSGEAADRQVVTVVDSAVEAQWGARVITRDARDTEAGDLTTMIARAQEDLTKGAPSAQVTTELSETEDFRFGVTFNLGDTVTVRMTGAPDITSAVSELDVTWDTSNGLLVVPHVGDADTSFSAVVASALASVDRRLNRMGRQ
jgi:hypothetical protein